MIDVENKVFTAVEAALSLAISGIFVSGDATVDVATFPAVTIFEMDNFTREQDVNLLNAAELAVIPYQADIYSNKANGAKAQCKEIRAVIDGVMVGKGFRLTYCSPIYKQDESISRMTIRYTKLQDGFGI